MNPQAHYQSSHSSSVPKSIKSGPGIRWPVTMAMLAAALLIPVAHAVVIDDFSTPQGPFENTCVRQTVLGAGILGGAREVWLRDIDDCSPGLVEVSEGTLSAFYATVFSILDVFVFYKGEDGAGFGPVDLTDGGSSDRFLVEVTGFMSETCGPHWFHISVPGPNASTDVLASQAVFVNGPGIYEYLFSDLFALGAGADLTAADAVTLSIAVRGKCVTPSGPSLITINSFTTGGPDGIADADGDGVADEDDLCPDTTAGPVDAVGCSDAQVDTDGDGWCDPDAPSSGPSGSGCVGADNCPTLANPDQADSNGDGFGDACVDPSVDIPGNADVDPTATIGADSEIKKGSVIDAGVAIGSDVTVNQGVAIGGNSSIGDGTTLNQDATIGANVTIGMGVIIGRGVVIEDGAVIGDFVVIDNGAFIGAGATVESYADIGRDAVICPAARVLSSLVLGRNAFVDTSVVQAGDIAGSPTTHSPGECAAPP